MNRQLKDEIIRAYEITIGDRVYHSTTYYYTLDENKKVHRVKWNVIKANYDFIRHIQEIDNNEHTIEEVALNLRQMFLNEMESNKN